MKILLSYSKRHFDPDKSREEHEHWGSSASILARTLFQILSEMGEVTYIDSSAYKSVVGREFDLFVGIPNNFTQIRNAVRAKKGIYFAVNMHPKERNSRLLCFMLRHRLDPRSIAGWDFVHVGKVTRALKVADHILCVGNIAVYNSYLVNGVSPAKIKMLNYGLPDVVVSTPKAPSGIHRYLYVASEIGLRKGFDIVYDLFAARALADAPFHLDIVGLPTNKVYERKLEQLKQQLGSKVTYHGWLDASGSAYAAVLDRADFLIYPSLEEGQAGSVLDAISRAVIPLLSVSAGLDCSPCGTLETRLGSVANRTVLRQTLELSGDDIVKLKQRVVDYYREYHQPFETVFRASLQRWQSPTLYPRVSLVLAIFNKQATIRSLLVHLDRVCRSYPNTDLHLIFDGCSDQTEAIVRRFYQQPPPYELRFSSTPNIFEVKSNNLGLRAATGEYACIIQDDNYLHEPLLLFEAVNFLDKNPTAAILGGLAGVNYFPRGTKLDGVGQIAQTAQEVYWRQDATTDPRLQQRIFQVDACMRGPLILRKSFLERYGYLDEVYAPLYQDDMDIGMRAAAKGLKVYCMLMDVENKSLTMANYDAKRNEFFRAIIERNTNTFYARWTPSSSKADYTWIVRVPMWRQVYPLRQVRRIVVGSVERFASTSAAYFRAAKRRLSSQRVEGKQSA